MPRLTRSSRRSFLGLLAGSASLSLAGCEFIDGSAVIKPMPRPIEIPVAGIPRSMREWNWGGGSCVFASWVMVERRLNLPELAAYIRKTYSGGESYNGLTSKMRKLGVPFYSAAGGGGQDVAAQHHKTIYLIDWLEAQGLSWFGTGSGDVDVLERSTAERRMAVIFYYANHSIAHCGFGPSAFPNISGTQSHVMDNNRIESYIEIPKDEFIRRWRGYGGVAVVPTHSEPPPPIPYVAG